MSKKSTLDSFIDGFFNIENNTLEGFTISQLHSLINIELDGAQRKTVLSRLHSKLSRLRTDEEREQLLKLRGKKKITTKDRKNWVIYYG